MKQSTFINLITAIYAIYFVSAVENAPSKRDTGEGKNYFIFQQLVSFMAIRVVEFSNGGYKIRKVFA